MGGLETFVRDMIAFKPEDFSFLMIGVDSTGDLPLGRITRQTYRGKETVADIGAYLERLDRLRIPFRLGLAEGATWAPSDALANNPNFQGYVVFLRNSP